MAFPDSWPPDCRPPADSFPPAGEFYRLVRTNPPTEADFLSFVELGKVLRGVVPCPCMPFGLSVYRDRLDAAHTSLLFPKLGRFLAVGLLDSTCGAVKPTPGREPTHTTWWPPDGFDRVTPFTRTEEAS